MMKLLLLAKTRYTNIEFAKERASYTKEKTINNLGDYLLEFEKNSQANGAKVLWARNSDDAINHIKKILLDNQAQLLVKSKSMISEELELNEEVERGLG